MVVKGSSDVTGARWLSRAHCHAMHRSGTHRHSLTHSLTISPTYSILTRIAHDVHGRGLSAWPCACGNARALHVPNHAPLALRPPTHISVFHDHHVQTYFHPTTGHTYLRTDVGGIYRREADASKPGGYVAQCVLTLSPSGRPYLDLAAPQSLATLVILRGGLRPRSIPQQKKQLKRNFKPFPFFLLRKLPR